ncbi:hypothetical protein [Halorhodospira halochloris]|uniref:hypothetical protein n=1 Tax=Halorhodospira halochloris TaxID=1052 RepID=UPI001EE7CEE4|nr:hypothetical protein [Halorhodospira halochloris]MCG5549486.1 hypothetical protein [Halorhodospira halochloris]
MLSQSGFVPIIEPVRESLRGLRLALRAVSEADAKSMDCCIENILQIVPAYY